jgi:uncharacterized membrane protein YjjP (DUF1212 family)
MPGNGTDQRQAEAAFAIIARLGAILFANGQTTHRCNADALRLSQALGMACRPVFRWGELMLLGPADRPVVAVPVSPFGVHMGKIGAATRLIDGVASRAIAEERIAAELEVVEGTPPSSSWRFVLAAGFGAAALAIVFGVTMPSTLIAILLIAGAGALLRRWIGRLSGNPFAQPIAAAGLAGLTGGVAIRFGQAPPDALVALCPCMVLVPGPHFLNGILDFAHGRVNLGLARTSYASLIVLVICAGLLAGLALAGVTLPVSGAFTPVPLTYDVLAAGVAVAAYGTFFSMPWRLLGLPVVIGMLAHAARWVLVFRLGQSAELGAFVACLIASAIIAPVALRTHMAFAGFAFASVVSLIPGVFLFRTSSAIVGLIARGGSADSALVQDAAADAATALLILVAMAFGLALPLLFVERILADRPE